MAMVINKITKLGVAVAVLGLGILVACSDDNVASSFSETNTGKPVEKVGTLADMSASEVRKIIDNNKLESCGSKVKKAALAKEADDADTNGVIVAQPVCETIYALNMDTRAQVVDVEGKPVAGATVYKGNCDFDYEWCQYVTDEDGYFYMDNEMYLTLSPHDLKYSFESMQLRVLSADTSLGANVFSSFASANVVKIDGKLYAELKQIVLEPLYTAKLYLDSLFVKIDENTPENDKTDIEEWNQRWSEIVEDKKDNVRMCLEKEGGLSYESHYDEKKGGYPLKLYPCQKLTEEDYKNGYVTLFGLPEGKYQLDIWNVGSALPSVEVKKP